jgi:hypothetical protein
MGKPDMKFHYLIVSALFTISNAAIAAPPVSYDTAPSLSTAVLEMQASRHTKSEKTTERAQPYRHTDEQNNSLARGALAKQGVPQNIVVTSMSQISTERYDPKENNNSLLRAALSMQYKATHRDTQDK